MLTVVCVLRMMPGSVYSPIWVERLAAGVRKHTKTEHRFVCLTDSPEPMRGVETIPLLHTEWPGKGWWSKLEVFREGLFTGSTVYLDLDTLVVGDVAELQSETGRFTAPRNYGGARYFCSTAFSFNRDYSLLYETFKADPMRWVKRWDDFRNGGIGDQAYMAEILMQNDLGCAYFADHLVPSYKHHCRHGYPHKAGAVAVAFHGRPKMDQLNDWAGVYWEGLA